MSSLTRAQMPVTKMLRNPLLMKLIRSQERCYALIQ